MTDAAGRGGKDSTSALDYCTTCDEQIDAKWRFCAWCGASVRPDDRDAQESTATRRRLGNKQGGRAVLVSAEDADSQAYPPFTTDQTSAPSPSISGKPRQRPPLYRRPMIIAPALVLVILATVLGTALYRTNSVMSTLRTVNTPPPEITDSTYIGIGDEDPDMLGGPITVETGPAQAALQEAYSERNLPEPQEQGFGARLQQMTSGVGDVAGAASVASGIGGGSNEGFTLLVMGVDAQPGAAIDIGVRPDVLMLIRFDPESNTCRMLSIPRDTRVELPGYGQSKVNHALMVGGIPYQLMVTEDFIEEPIDHYVLVDFVAFEEAVTVVGGVDVTVPVDLQKNGEIRYSEGTYQFNGEEALSYARFRTPSDDGDIGRVQRQWSVLAGLANAAQGRDLITDVNTLVPTVEEHIRTDLTLTEMTAIARDYGDDCLTIDTEAIALIQGSRVQFNDPILDQVVYYNAVDETTVQRRVQELLAGTASAAEVQHTGSAPWSRFHP